MRDLGLDLKYAVRQGFMQAGASTEVRAICKDPIGQGFMRVTSVCPANVTLPVLDFIDCFAAPVASQEPCTRSTRIPGTDGAHIPRAMWQCSVDEEQRNCA